MDCNAEVSIWAVREQLERIERSTEFVDSGRLQALLRHLVTESLAGHGATLREAMIGKVIYAREPAYDPRFDSTVRVEARRLRRKLQAYYARQDPLDRVRIELPTGGYVPVFSIIGDQPGAAVTVEALEAEAGSIFRAGPGVALAIMPFTALSPDTDTLIFADELTDELIFAMGQAEGLRVASRGVTFGYRNRAYSAVAIARELGADCILQGSVRRSGGMLRVTVELADTEGFVSWSDRFDGQIKNRVELQERIATTILSRSQLDNSKMRARQIGPKPSALPANATIYRARLLLDRQEPEALRQALALFSQVAAATPDYARGPSGIADCHCDLFRLGDLDWPTARTGAWSAARQALAIDPNSIEAHTAMATILAWLDWNRPAAETSFREALRLGGNARCLRLFGVFLTHGGQHAEADRMFRRARAVQPFSTQQDCAEALCNYQRRHFTVLVAPSVEEGVVPAEVMFYRAIALAFEGHSNAARHLAERLRVTGAEQPLLRTAAAEICGWAGDGTAARQALEHPYATASGFGRATLAMAAGAHDVALEALTQALERRELALIWLRMDKRFDGIRASNRFAALLDRLSTWVQAPGAC